MPVKQATLVSDLCDAVAQFLEGENANQKFKVLSMATGLNGTPLPLNMMVCSALYSDE